MASHWATSSSSYGAFYSDPNLSPLKPAREPESTNLPSDDSNLVHVPKGITTTEEAAAREEFLAAYGTEHEGKDTESNVVGMKGGLTTTSDAAAREEFLAAYGTEHVGRDTQDNLGPGMVPTAEAAAGLAFADYYGDQHVGKDTASQLVGTERGFIAKE